MSARRLLAALAAVLVIAIGADVSRAQGQGAPGLNAPGEFVLGYSYAWYHRDMPPTVPVEKRWEVASIDVSFGAAEWLMLALRGGYWNVSYDALPKSDYERYVAGAGFAARLHRFRRFSLIGEFQFDEVLDLDQSTEEFHKSTRSVLVGVYASARRRDRHGVVDVWAGPAFVRDVGKNYVFGAFEPMTDDSSDNFGAVVGARLTLFDRLVSSAALVYAGYVQPRLAVGVRL